MNILKFRYFCYDKCTVILLEILPKKAINLRVPWCPRNVLSYHSFRKINTSFLFTGESRPLGTSLKIDLPLSFVDPCLPKWGPWISSISITWRPIRIAGVQAQPQGLNLHFNESSRWFVCRLKFKECCHRSVQQAEITGEMHHSTLQFIVRTCHVYHLLKYPRINTQ